MVPAHNDHSGPEHNFAANPDRADRRIEDRIWPDIDVVTDFNIGVAKIPPVGDHDIASAFFEEGQQQPHPDAPLNFR